MKYRTSPLTPFLAAVPQNSLHCLLAHSRVSRTPQALSDCASMPCALLNSLVALFSTAVVCFQELARSFAKTPGVGVPRQQLRHSRHGSQPWLTELHNFGAPVNTFRINTCISVASKRLYLPLESTLMKKGGEGGPGGRSKDRRYVPRKTQARSARTATSNLE